MSAASKTADDMDVSHAVSESPEVAIVIPCYRYAEMLPEAVASAVAQTWPNLRIVIVDDGSPDDTAAVANELIARYPEHRIELLRQSNQGLSAARNAGVRATSSPFVLPLDADDQLEPASVATLLRALQDHGADVATPNGRTFGDEDKPLITMPVTKRRLVANNCLIYSSMYRRELFDRVGGYGPIKPGYEDWDFWLSALDLDAKFTHVATPLFRYRKHGATMLSVADRHAMRLFATIAVNHPRLYSPWRVRLAKRLLAAGETASVWLRLGMLATFLIDRRLRLFVRQLSALRATNMLST
ncbi:MAG: glycosyltransferase involved in cell wall biosynthesis [Planctomycetota bacterium]